MSEKALMETTNHELYLRSKSSIRTDTYISAQLLLALLDPNSNAVSPNIRIITKTFEYLV